MEDFLNDEHFTSFSLTDFDKYFLENDVEIPDEKQYRVLIDIINGHMKDLIGRKSWPNKNMVIKLF